MLLRISYVITLETKPHSSIEQKSFLSTLSMIYTFREVTAENNGSILLMTLIHKHHIIFSRECMLR